MNNKINLRFRNSTHKENESSNDCQDHFKTTKDEDCIAIADGASQSFYSGVWAEMLVQHFCQNPDINEGNWEEWLCPIQEEWLSKIKQRVEIAKSENKSTWITNYNRLNAREPATSTFVGLQFIKNQIKVSIVGDSCLFIFRNSKLTTSYLLKSSKDFNDRPEYFASYAKDNIFRPRFFDVSLDNEKEIVHFILATDALAEWILKNEEQRINIIPTLLEISSLETFVAKARNSQEIALKNDDVTLVIVEVFGQTQTLAYNPIKDDLGSGRVPGQTQTPESLFTENKKLKQKINFLQKQKKNLRISTIICTFLALMFLFFNYLDKKVTLTTNSEASKPEPSSQPSPTKTNPNLTPPKTEPKSIDIPKESIIYNQDNQQLIKDRLSKQFKVLIIEENNERIKFEIQLYVHNNARLTCPDCGDKEIQLNTGYNIRTSASSDKDNNIFGQLKSASKFEKLKSENPDWSKFKFVGYLKK